MPSAKPSGSVPTKGRGWAWPFSHNTGDIVGAGGHVGSVLAVSANPTTSPRLLMALACPLLPPTVGRALMWPSRQRNGTHVRNVPKPQMSSPLGSRTDVSDIPTASPWSLIPPQLIQLLPVAGFPSVPRSMLTPSRLTTARPLATVVNRLFSGGFTNPSMFSVEP